MLDAQIFECPFGCSTLDRETCMCSIVDTMVESMNLPRKIHSPTPGSVNGS